MQAKVLTISLMVCVFAFIGFLNSTALSGDPEEIVKYYESCIFREIKKCDLKLVLLSKTKSENLQDYAKMEAQKAEFFRAEKDMLIKEMMETQLDPKHYKIELFLNSRFKKWNRYKN
jgi:hypothetical protein